MAPAGRKSMAARASRSLQSLSAAPLFLEASAVCVASLLTLPPGPGEGAGRGGTPDGRRRFIVRFKLHLLEIEVVDDNIKLTFSTPSLLWKRYLVVKNVRRSEGARQAALQNTMAV